MATATLDRTATALLPPDVRLMNATAAALAVAAAILVAAMVVLGLARQPFFAIRSISVDGEVARNSVSTIRANAAPKLAGNFMTMDLRAVRRAFESVPWVRLAVVRRVWPNRLRVQLEEHRPVAIWGVESGAEKLVNSFGEVFEANVGDVEDESLPEFAGPDGSSAQVLAMYRRLLPVFQQLGTEVTGLALSGRGSWKVELESGAQVELGRGTEEEVSERTARFVRTVPAVLRKFRAPLESADLRHAEGYAVKLKGVSIAADVKTPPQQPSAREN
jgi:cell division protein FtsQ